MDEVVVVGSARTPIGRFGGALSELPAVELGGQAIEAALSRAAMTPAVVDYIVMGHVLQAGLGQITSRQAAVRAGVGMDVPAETVNKVCLSGLTAIARAADMIRMGHAQVVVAGGMESMSRAPYLLDRARFGYRLGDGEIIDTLMRDGLTCAFDGCSMGLATDRYQSQHALDISRAEQDHFAARSHERARSASESGHFGAEIVPVEVAGRRESVTVTRDEGIRDDVTEDSLARLRPVFSEDGDITAGNASQMSDGAAAVVLASRSFAEREGLAPVGRIGAWGAVAGPDPSLHLQPARAIRAAAHRAGHDPAAFDTYEINEAFASVAIASMRDLGLDEDRVNVHGGAIALGHPLGCSGARLVVTLLNTLHQRGGGRGVAALCGGGGQGDALVVDVGAD